MEWAFAITERLKNTDHYIQHSSHLAEIEINMHGNPLVILTAYMPHDASAEIKRLAAWEEMSNRIRSVTHNKNVVILGGLNAALHARKEGEEECLGPHVWGKGLTFLREKEGLLPEHINRNILIEQLKEHDMRCMNFFLKNQTRKQLVGTCGQQGCRDLGTQIDIANWIYA